MSLFSITKPFLFLLFTLISYFNVHGQSEYDIQINLAELSIIKNDYERALFCYDKAFKTAETLQYRFAVDLYNATLSAIEINDKELAFTYCLQLAKKGLGIPFFEKKVCFSKIRGNSRWEEILKAADSSMSIYRKRSGLIIDSVDRIVRRDYTSDSSYLLNPSKTSEDTVAFLRQKHEAITNILNLTNQYGFLYEDLIGVQMKNDTTPAFVPKFYRLKYLATGIPSLLVKYDRMIWEAIQERKIKPDLGAYCLIDEGSIDPFSFYQIVDCNLYANADGEQLLNRLDKNRKKLSLSHTYDYILKCLYNLKNPNSKFYIFAPPQLISYKNEYSKSSFLSRSILLFENVCE